MFMKYYLSNESDAKTDAYISPITTPDWILKEYPETILGIAEYDPLRDDTFRFGLRMLKLGKQCRLIYARYLRHDPVCYTMKTGGIEQAFVY